MIEVSYKDVKKHFSKKGGIYKFENQINSKGYTGKTYYFYKRLKQHLDGEEDSGTRYFCNALKKYGKENFKYFILEEIKVLPDHSNDRYFIEREGHYMDEGKTLYRKYGYNLDDPRKRLAYAEGRNGAIAKLNDGNKIYDFVSFRGLAQYLEVSFSKFFYDAMSFTSNIVEYNGCSIELLQMPGTTGRYHGGNSPIPFIVTNELGEDIFFESSVKTLSYLGIKRTGLQHYIKTKGNIIKGKFVRPATDLEISMYTSPFTVLT